MIRGGRRMRGWRAFAAGWWALAAGLTALDGAAQTKDAPAENAPASSQTKAARPAIPTAANARANYRSQHFYLHTDLSAKEAEALLERLEHMLALVSEYWGKPAEGIIEMYVVRHLEHWPADSMPDAEGLAMIRAGGGLTISQVLGSTGKSTVYAVADEGTPLHEAVHAYCHQNFGTSGPTWYSEGMAEMGHYWRKDDTAVKVHEAIVAYIRKSEPKSLAEIVDGKDRTGDSWQNYAWRWALCHLLANNTNYAAQFRPLGLGILQRKPVSFQETYGRVEKEISFEYQFFLKHLSNGYRVDLCSWDWKRPFSAPSVGETRMVRVQADRGWQPSGIEVRPGVRYLVSTAGSWKLEAKNGEALGADGDSRGEGRLVGVIYKNYQLSDEFEIGSRTALRAGSDGQLFLRMKSDWGSIADNSGAVEVKITVAR